MANRMVKSNLRKEMISFSLQDTVHHWGKSGKDLKENFETETVEESCLLASSLVQSPANVQLVLSHIPGPSA